jgi:hypothetical protein
VVWRGEPVVVAGVGVEVDVEVEVEVAGASIGVVGEGGVVAVGPSVDGGGGGPCLQCLDAIYSVNR